MTQIFHITHVDNLPGIAAGGILCDKERLARALDSVNIAYEDLKDRRARTEVTRGPGGTLADYAPFYFAPRSPMLCAIAYNRVPGMEGKQKEVVHLVSECEAVEDAGIGFAFTDGHAIMALSDFYDDLDDLDQVDWNIMKAQYWNNDGIGEQKRRRQAEFLVEARLPWELVTEIGVATDEMAARTRAAINGVAHQPPVVVHADWYY